MNNRGFSLIEMILALALTSFVALGVSTLMLYTSKNYNNSMTELELQSNAQILMNTVTDRILEGNNVYFDDAKKMLVIYHDDLDAATYDYKDIIWFKDGSGKMYLFKATSSVEENTIMDMINGVNTGYDKYLLADYVDSFSSSQTSVTGTSTGMIDVTMSFSSQGRSYTLMNNIKLRNRVVVIP